MSRETELLRTLLDTSKLISSNFPIQTVIRRITGKLRTLLGADECSIMILDENSRELAFCESSGLSEWEKENIRFKLGEGIAGWVARNRKPALVEDVSSDPRFVSYPRQRRKMVSMICAPLNIRRRLIGVLSLTTRESGHVFTPDELERVVLIAAHISLAMENHRLYELSVLDGLTNIYNRRYLEQRLGKEMAYARRFRKPLSVLLLDIDFFKRLNDTYGHQAGDHALREVSDTLSATLREYDVVARYGGEEFAVILPATPRTIGATIGERLRLAVEQHPFRYRDKVLPVTISLGVASFPEDGGSPEEVLRAADRALYRAKQAGRNQVALS
ncbi:MAG: sensor domain-containing diguanylate cyclase [Armatimonadetes bacterium]|nr:sensor domain-containing diguanylate cyclase [Armatimonadota bacterium]